MGKIRRSQRPLRVGLTGSLASGKSTALKFFKKFGWKVSSADEIVAEIYKERGISKADLIKKFGTTHSGLKKLEKWVHPLVAKKIFKLMKSSKKPFIAEVPLLFEAKFDRFFDSSIFIFAPLKDRKKRAKHRGMDPKLFKYLDHLQLTPAEKARRADFVIENKSKHSLKRKIRLLSKMLLDS